MTDFTSANGLSAFGTGAIYKIRALPSATDVPALGLGAVVLSLGLLAGIGLRRLAQTKEPSPSG